MKTITRAEIEKEMNAPYIYHLKYQGKIVYVGKSTSLMFRLAEHARGKKRVGETEKQWDECDYYAVAPEMTDLQESLDIIKYRPQYNRQISVSPDAVGLVAEHNLPCEDAYEYVMDLFNIRYYQPRSDGTTP